MKGYQEKHSPNKNKTACKNGLLWFFEDIRNLSPALAALFLYWLLTRLIFDRFCPMLILTDIPCPGCGMTRALILALTGRFAEAWALQPPVYGWILFGTLFCLRRYFPGLFGGKGTAGLGADGGLAEKAASGKMTFKAMSVRERRLWLLALAVLFLLGIGLYGVRLVYGFPKGVLDPGRTVFELTRRG